MDILRLAGMNAMPARIGIVWTQAKHNLLAGARGLPEPARGTGRLAPSFKRVAGA